MGVDYYHCKACNESLYEEYVGSCTGCGTRLCTGCLVNKDVEYHGKPSRFAYHYGIRFDSNNEELVAELLKDGYITKDENGDYDIEEGEIISDTEIQPKYCPYCQGNEINKDEVLEYLLKKSGLTLKQAWKELKKTKK